MLPGNLKASEIIILDDVSGFNKRNRTSRKFIYDREVDRYVVRDLLQGIGSRGSGIDKASPRFVKQAIRKGKSQAGLNPWHMPKLFCIGSQ